MDLDDVQADLAAFADQEGDVAIDSDGSFLMSRNGRELSGLIVERPDGSVSVRMDGNDIPYRRFITHELAGLATFAERLTARRPVNAFVDGPVRVRRAAEDPKTGASLAILREECEEATPFSSRISFITADAGHGKTALLREFQYSQAQAFLAGTGSYLFWHLDLQGRQLLRLSEALMGDLGDLRISGLWMPAVIRLMRQRALVLAIDGFDELAAEQGGTDALGALASLVSHLGGRGTVIAAARRTFFDTEDYLRRSGIIGRALRSPCQFNQLELLPWSRIEAVGYLGNIATKSTIAIDPGTAYEQILAELGGAADHPMLTRPFLLAQVARALTEYNIPPAEFMRTADDALSGVEAVVQAFVRREVSEKWKFRDTGEAYLSEAQHMQFLADVAEEMYRSQKDRLELDVIETIAALLLDQWGIEQNRKQQIVDMVRMHVLLVPPGDGNARVRAFDHPEFRDYFIAYALRSHIDRVMDGAPASGLARFFSIAQISDSTARYVCGMLDRSEVRVRRLLAGLQEALAREWKPTFLQSNVGTLLPFVLGGLDLTSKLEFSGPAVYSSLVFERSLLRNVSLEQGTFVNVSLAGVDWQDVKLKDCALGEIMLDESARFVNVIFENCRVDGLRIQGTDEEIREYAPERVWRRLREAGIRSSRQETLAEAADASPADPVGVDLLRRILRVFNRTMVITDVQIRYRFKQEHHYILDVIVPLLERHGVLEPRTWHASGHGRVWGLVESLDDVLGAEGGAGKASLVSVWTEAADL